MNTNLNKNILISGASIAGPALAYWLHRYGYNVTIVEKAPQLREGGYRVDVRGTAVKVIEKMGLLPALKASSTALHGSSMVNSKGKQIASFDDPDVFGMRRNQDVEIMRGDLSVLLYEATRDQVEYIFDDSITGILQTADKVHVLFKKNESRTFDLVIAADGLHSNVRNLVFGKETDFVKHLGAYISIFSIPDYFGLKQWELSYAAAGKVVNVYHAKTGGTKAVFLFAPDEPVTYNYQDTKQQQGIIAEHFKNAGWETGAMIKDMPASSDFYFDSISQVHMDSLSEGRVALVGDAGYCPSPASGQGTSLALVGAYVLAGELAKAHGNHRAAYASYEKEMKEYIRINQELGVKVLKEMVPVSRKQVLFQRFMLRLMLRLPGGRKMMKRMLDKIGRNVEIAANSIRLKDYPLPAKQYAVMAE